MSNEMLLLDGGGAQTSVSSTRRNLLNKERWFSIVTNAHNLKKKDILYYARIIPQTSIYEVCELSIRTIEDTYFVGTDKRDKHAYLFSYNAIDKTVFHNRKDALKIVKEAENNKPKDLSTETDYEEY